MEGPKERNAMTRLASQDFCRCCCEEAEESIAEA